MQTQDTTTPKPTTTSPTTARRAGNMLCARITIAGTRPLLWHHFGPDAIPLEKQERTGVAGNDPIEWTRTVLKTADGQLYVQGGYIFGTLREGARNTKKGRGSIQAALSSTLQVLDDRVLIDRWMPDGEPTTDPDEPVYIDVRSVRNPATRGRNIRYRVAARSGWRASFAILWDKTIVSRGEMETVAIDAGRLVGIGDGRAIGLGRFVVECFEVGDA